MLHFKNPRITLDLSYHSMSYLSQNQFYLFIQEILFEHKYCSGFFIYTGKICIKFHQTHHDSFFTRVPYFCSPIHTCTTLSPSSHKGPHALLHRSHAHSSLKIPFMSFLMDLWTCYQQKSHFKMICVC